MLPPVLPPAPPPPLEDIGRRLGRDSEGAPLILIGSDLRHKADTGDACLLDRSPWGPCPVALQNLTVALRLGGVELALSNALSFSFYDPDFFAIRAISPFGGPSDGGTPVNVRLIDSRLLVNLGGLACRFSAAAPLIPFASHQQAAPITATVTASVLAMPRAIRCLAPRMPPQWSNTAGYAKAAIAITLNGFDFSSPASQLFHYYVHSGVAMGSFSPWGGPHAGGTLVQIQGHHMRTLGAVRCRFGLLSTACWSTVPGTIVNASNARCVSPIHRRLSCSTEARIDAARYGMSTSRPVYPQAVPLCLMLNGVDCLPTAFLAVSQQRYFSYYASEGGPSGLELLQLSPQGGPAVGGTYVIVRGSAPFINYGGLSCVFESVLVPASAVAPSSSSLHHGVECIAPSSLSLGLFSGRVSTNASTANVQLRVTLNGDVRAASYDALAFTYYSQRSLLGMHPRTGPVAGGTPVTLTGIGLSLGLDGGRGLLCRFGSAVVPAYSLRMSNDAPAQSEIVCASPSAVMTIGISETVPEDEGVCLHLRPSVQVSLTLNGGSPTGSAWHASPFAFNYFGTCGVA